MPEADAAFEASDFDHGVLHGWIDEAGLAEAQTVRVGRLKRLGLGVWLPGAAFGFGPTLVFREAELAANGRVFERQLGQDCNRARYWAQPFVMDCALP